MDFALPAEDDPRRISLRRWLDERPRPTARELAEAGLVAPHWAPIPPISSSSTTSYAGPG
jgi:hypothetical protein